jgi:phospholipase D3/4
MNITDKKSFFLILLIVIIFYLSLPVNSQQSLPVDNFYLVESVPVETILEQSGLPRTIDVWLDMINNAKSTLDIEMFYIANRNGEVLEKIISAVKKASERDVIIRIIIDEEFYKSNEKSVDELNDLQNITIRKIPFKDISGGVMHAKYFVADGYDLFMGSQNMDWRALKHIHEMGVRVKNKKLAKTFLNIFNIDWDLSDKDKISDIGSLKKLYGKNIINSSNRVTIDTKEFGSVKIYPAFSSPDVIPNKCNNEEKELIKIINKADDRLYIQMYSYSLKGKNKNSTYDKIDRALKRAANRGVQIKIIFSNWAIRSGATESIKELSSVPNIEIKFSSIPEYSGGFIPYSRVEHCKYFICDYDVSWISTANWEWGYFHEMRNATIIIKNVKVNSELEKIFLRDWNGPYTEFVDINKEYKQVTRNK